MMNQGKVVYKDYWSNECLVVIAALANTEGGELNIGKNLQDKNKKLDNIYRLMEKIPKQLVNNLGLSIPINIFRHNGVKYIKINVIKSTVPITYQGKYYIYKGNYLQRLTGNELTNFLLPFTEKCWDSLFEENATFDCIDSKTIEQFLENSTIRLPYIKQINSKKELLEKLSLAENGKLKRAAILLFGNNTQKFFPSAYLKIGKFHKDSQIIAHDTIRGNLFQQIQEAEKILKTKYLKYIVKFDGLKRIEKLEYPEIVLRELLVNSLVHKDYTGTTIQLKIFPNRLVIWNEGKLPEDFYIENLFIQHPSKPRNELLANIFFYANYFDAWGHGFQLIFDACEDYGLPIPKIEEKFGGLQVTVLKNVYKDKK